MAQVRLEVDGRPLETQDAFVVHAMSPRLWIMCVLDRCGEQDIGTQVMLGREIRIVGDDRLS